MFPMPLQNVELDTPEHPVVPARVRALLDEAQRRIEEFFSTRDDKVVPGYVPSDFERVFVALEEVVRRRLSAGDAFCEWGHGFGVVASMAAMLGFGACGIEIDPDLVHEAQALAEVFNLDVEFVCGTFVPAEGQDLLDMPTEFTWLDAGGTCGHELLGVGPDDFDLIFAYPWPGEESVIDNLFERFASVGALLLTFHGHDDVRLRRKVTRRRPTID